MKKYTQQEEFAIQQFTGMHYSKGLDVFAVCRGMNLTSDEWENIEKDCSWLSEYELQQINEYLVDGWMKV